MHRDGLSNLRLEKCRGYFQGEVAPALGDKFKIIGFSDSDALPRPARVARASGKVHPSGARDGTTVGLKSSVRTRESPYIAMVRSRSPA